MASEAVATMARSALLLVLVTVVLAMATSIMAPAVASGASSSISAPSCLRLAALYVLRPKERPRLIMVLRCGTDYD